MGKDTDFDFGANVDWRDSASNLAPWGKTTEADKSNPLPGGKADSASVSENWLLEQTCAVVLKQVRLLTETVRKGNRTAMSINLKKYYNEKDRKADFKQNPFLEISDIPKKSGLKAVVTSLRENTSGHGYSHLFLGIKNGKKEYTVGLKKDSVLLGQLCQQLGTNDARWIGKTVTFVLAKGKYINLQLSILTLKHRQTK